MVRLYLLALILTSVTLTSQAANIELGKSLKSLTIADKGELLQKGKGFEFQPWSSDRLRGKLHVVQYLAASMSARAINKPFTDKLNTLKKHQEKYIVTVVLNLDDALWGTSLFVISSLKRAKKGHPESSLVVDKNALGRQHWQLKKDNSAIMVINKSGEVIYFKEGAMTEQEISSTIQLIQENW